MESECNAFTISYVHEEFLEELGREVDCFILGDSGDCGKVPY